MRYFILLLVGLVSCSKEVKQHDTAFTPSNKVAEQQNTGFKIEYINSECDTSYLSSPFQLEANFKALYYGPQSNNIKVDLKNHFTQWEMFSHFNDVMHINDANIVHLIGMHPLHPATDYADILIDTTIQIQTKYILNEKKKGIGKSEICVSHYPVIIKNKHVSFFCVGYGDELDFVIEAFNAEGEWSPITHPPIRFCGTGLYWVPLSANEMVISAIPITQGKFKTKGRIRLGEVTSNEINISIDPNAFNFPL